MIQTIVPRDLLPPHLSAQQFIGAINLKSSPVAEAFGALVVSLMRRLPTSRTQEAGYLERALVDLCVAVAMESVGDSNVPLGTDGMRFRARALIERNLHDPSLGPSTIAAELNISVRQLHRTFNTEDESIARFILKTRLDGVAKELRSESSVRQLTEIAERFGFAGTDQLSRAFKANFGMTMSQYRNTTTTHLNA
jgi:AraC-like DNA-binding protein